LLQLVHTGFSSPHFTLRALHGQHPVRERFFGGTSEFSFFGLGMSESSLSTGIELQLLVLSHPRSQAINRITQG
jgi:hypothetical protein